MALLAAHGEITPMPDCAIFADTGWEPKAVYKHLRWLMSPNVLPFPVRIVRNGNIRESLTTSKPGRYEAVPFYLKTNNGYSMGRRQCTHEYKLKPLRWAYRELLGKGRKERIKGGAVTAWIGISFDEVMRMKESGIAWCVNRWPLVEKRFDRQDCLRWLEGHRYPLPPKSSCIGCPFHNDNYWRAMRDHTPEEFADAVSVDHQIRNGGTQFTIMRAEQFIHPSCVPPDQVDLSTAADHGQLNLFNNECQGMCGV